MKINYQILLNNKKPEPYFEKWKGNPAQIHGYSVTHSVLEIRVTNESTDTFLTIYCGEVLHVNSPVKWQCSDFEMETLEDGILLKDALSGTEIHAGFLGIEEQ